LAQDPENIQRLLIVMYTVMHVASPSVCATFGDHITSQLQETLRSNPPTGWKVPVILVAFDVLSFMCDLPKKKLAAAHIISGIITYCKTHLQHMNEMNKNPTSSKRGEHVPTEWSEGAKGGSEAKERR
jgi:hypothetical protein